ncbi:MAG TPA: hypothetical protein VKB50_00360 [Vicinamibacterales bacterium]|nr:hypothetical protein [Vicinamibacterales bacterium]
MAAAHPYERRHRPLLPRRKFLKRAALHVALAAVIVVIAVTIGTVGYAWLGGLPWLDAFLNASMILGGMGPVDRMETAPAKLFSALYALFSGLVFVGLMGIVLAPWVHRLLHWTHLEDTSERQ